MPTRDLLVATPPPKPLLVFDGDCHFCKLWIRRWQQITTDTVDYLPSLDPAITTRFPEIPRDLFKSAVVLIEIDGAVYSGAEAVARALAINPKYGWLLGAYQDVPGLAPVANAAYRVVAGHRPLFGALTRLFWGRHTERPEYVLTRWLFLRALGLIYLVAFISLWTQVGGLIGHNGILPADQFMSSVQQQCDAHGIGLERYYLLPTLNWLDTSDGFLKLQCAAGTLLPVALIFGLAPAPCLALLWLIYLSLSTVGRDFFGFQWDCLLLETGFLAIFFAPLQWTEWGRPVPTSKFLVSNQAPPSRIILWLLRRLLFKLMFSSGCVKLLSGDPHWRDLTALTYHYQTQPLPTWIGWLANQLPLTVQKISCALVFLVEIAVPFLIFLPRRPRGLAAILLAMLQVLILLTGNYTFFNFLALALCLTLLDDFTLRAWLPAKLVRRFVTPPEHSEISPAPLRWPRAITIPLAAVVASISLFQLVSMFGVRPAILLPAAALDGILRPLRSVNTYGLFALMTTERREISVEGSDDGIAWLPYDFKYKPDKIYERPEFVEPFQPRLDWQMWFAALGDAQENPWFGQFCQRLLQGSPEVLALMNKNPFPDHPPRYLRAELYEYKFTTFAEHNKTGAWWKREQIGEYLPARTLQN